LAKHNIWWFERVRAANPNPSWAVQGADKGQRGTDHPDGARLSRFAGDPGQSRLVCLTAEVGLAGQDEVRGIDHRSFLSVKVAVER
jgi:hypothetical protein